MNKNSNYTNSNVKFLREFNNVSQSKMSKDLNIDQSTLAKWENGTRQITLEWAIKIADYFDISIGDFISKDFLHKTKKEIIYSEMAFKRVLREKGLMDEDGNIDEESFNTLMRIADMMKEIKKEK